MTNHENQEQKVCTSTHSMYLDTPCTSTTTNHNTATNLTNQRTAFTHIDQSATSCCAQSTNEHSDDTDIVTFTQIMHKLRDCVWYWGPISWEQAEAVLADSRQGSFLLRDSTSDRYIFTLSYKTEHSIAHVRLPHHHGNFSFGGPSSPLRSSSVHDLISQAVTTSKTGAIVFMLHRSRAALDQSISIRLLHPISRMGSGHVPSLKHQCRFSIVRGLHRRLPLIHTLPLSHTMKLYLADNTWVAELPPWARTTS